MGVDVIDFTELQKKGLLKRAADARKLDDVQVRGVSVPASGMLDLTNSANSPSVTDPLGRLPSFARPQPAPSAQAVPSNAPAGSSESSAFDFLSSFAQLGASQQQNTGSGFDSNTLGSANTLDSGVHEKLDKLSSALERIEERLARIEQTHGAGYNAQYGSY